MPNCQGNAIPSNAVGLEYFVQSNWPESGNSRTMISHQLRRDVSTLTLNPRQKVGLWFKVNPVPIPLS